MTSFAKPKFPDIIRKMLFFTILCCKSAIPVWKHGHEKIFFDESVLGPHFVMAFGAEEFMLQNVLAAERPHPGFSGSYVIVSAERLVEIITDIHQYFFSLFD